MDIIQYYKLCSISCIRNSSVEQTHHLYLYSIFAFRTYLLALSLIICYKTTSWWRWKCLEQSGIPAAYYVYYIHFLKIISYSKDIITHGISMEFKMYAMLNEEFIVL